MRKHDARRICPDIGAALLDGDGEEMADRASKRTTTTFSEAAGLGWPNSTADLRRDHGAPRKTRRLRLSTRHRIKDLKYGARLLGCARVLDQTRMSLNDPMNWSAAIQNVSKLGGGVTDEKILAGFTALIIPDKDHVELGG